MAKKNQDTEAKIASLKEELEKLRNENHNLKRRVKRMEDRKASEKEERVKSQAERNRRAEEVMMGSAEDIKKKLTDAGMDVRSAEAAAWFLSPDTGILKR